MLKLTNAQISVLNSPVVKNLCEDTTRPFPLDDAFRLAAILDAIGPRVLKFQEAARKIISRHGGEIGPTGAIAYPDTEMRVKASEELNLLNTVELEYVGEKLTPTKEWPKLTLAEAAVLRPIIKHE